MDCPLCCNTKSLTVSGIVRVFLLPKLPYPVLALIFAAAAFFLTPYLYILSVILLLLPLAQADMRLYLFLPLLFGHLAGKEVNCPSCNPGGTLFRSRSVQGTGKDRFME
ncbi:MAG: hypothetical protein J6331_02130 [Lentisphaeria bacterium]|nr:hypothetical protein [Lentisphaeria bacterium]